MRCTYQLLKFEPQGDAQIKRQIAGCGYAEQYNFSLDKLASLTSDNNCREGGDGQKGQCAVGWRDGDDTGFSEKEKNSDE